jgi:hypothetical protein
VKSYTGHFDRSSSNVGANPVIKIPALPRGNANGLKVIGTRNGDSAVNHAAHHHMSSFWGGRPTRLLSGTSPYAMLNEAFRKKSIPASTNSGQVTASCIYWSAMTAPPCT